MELGAEISQKVKKTIKKQLQTLGCYVDDELPEYIMVMIANKRTQVQMVEDLNLFLNDEAEKFVSWLVLVLGRIQKAMELPDIDGIADDVGNMQDSKKKSKKLKKERKKSGSEESNMKNSEKYDEIAKKRKSEEKWRTKEKTEKETEEREREKRKQERNNRQKEKESKENERRDKERKQRMEERLKKEKEREEEINKRKHAREEDINKRRVARELREKEDNEKRSRDEKGKREKEDNEILEKENKEKQRKRKESKKLDERRHKEKEKSEKDGDHSDETHAEKVNGMDESRKTETDVDVRKNAENEAKRIENRGSGRNPMEFVKKIAKDINNQLLTSESTESNKTDDANKEVSKSKDESGSHHEDDEAKKDSNKLDVSMRDNVSLQAVSQYEDGENDVEKGDGKTQQRTKKLHKHHRHHRSENKSSSRSRSRSETRHQNRKEARTENNRSKSSKSRSRERGHKHHRSHSHSPSKERQERKSRKDHDKRSSSKKDEPSDGHHSKTKIENAEDSNKRRSHDTSRNKDSNDSSKRKDDKSKSPRRRSSHGSRSRKDSSNEGSKRRDIKDATIKVEDEEEPAKPSLSSQVQIYTDFKRKPSLAKHHQASSALLKRAVTEVVNEKPEGDENAEDDLELDYNETNDEEYEDEVSDESENEVISEGRRVINFDKEQSGLATITVNFNKDHLPHSDNDSKHQRTVKSHDRDRNRTEKGSSDRHGRTESHGSTHSRKLSDEKEGEHRKGIIPGISKYDARYTILRSRMEHEAPSQERKQRHETNHEKSSNREKCLGSMVADMEEKSKHRSRRGNWRDHRSSTDSNRKHVEVQKSRRRRHSRGGDGDSSAEDEKDKQQRVKQLKEEARRIEMQELARSGHSDEGDLRDLLVGKRELKSSSDDEDEIARKLREKIKEEKHKRLFGKLNPEEKDRFKKERENLRGKLETKSKRRKRKSNKDSPEWIERLPEKNIESKYKEYDVKNEHNVFVENITESEEEEELKDENVVSEEDTEVKGENEEESEQENAHQTDVEADDESEEEEIDGEEAALQEVVDESNDRQGHDLEEISEDELESEEEMVNECLESNQETEEYRNKDEEKDQNEDGNMEEESNINEEGGQGEELEEEEIEEEVEIEVEVSDSENINGLSLDQELQVVDVGENHLVGKESNEKGNNIEEKMETEEEQRVIAIQHVDNADEEVSTDVVKQIMHVESSDESLINDENHTGNNMDAPPEKKISDKYEKKPMVKPKYTKRKRMKPEFIVTLDGLDGGKRTSMKTRSHSNSRERSPKSRRLQEKQKNDRHRKHKSHVTKSQSDEEFEEILRKKDEEEKRHNEQNSRVLDGKKSHRSRSQPSNEKDSKHERVDSKHERVDREIMLAENKLKAQKLFKKSLETVQNVSNDLEQQTLKAAYINNSNFQSKLQPEDLNPTVTIIPIKLGFNAQPLKLIPTPPVINQKQLINIRPSPPENMIPPPIAVPPPIVVPLTKENILVPTGVQISVTKDNFSLPTSPLDIVALPHVDISGINKSHIKASGDISSNKGVEETTVCSEPNNSSQQRHNLTDNVDGVNIPVSSPTMEVEKSVGNESMALPIAPVTQAKSTFQERCTYWPGCTNQTCPFIHPSVNCKLFPNCSYGQHCLYIHPPCMFGDSCSNASCPFTHVSSTPSVFSGFTQICKFYPNCAKVDCPFKHVDKPCQFGAACGNPDCLFSHDNVQPPNSSYKWVSEKAHVSERKFAADDAIVTHIPVSIVTSNT